MPEHIDSGSVLGTTYQLDKFIKHTQPKWIVVLDAVDDATKEAQGDQAIVRPRLARSVETRSS